MNQPVPKGKNGCLQSSWDSEGGGCKKENTFEMCSMHLTEQNVHRQEATAHSPLFSVDISLIFNSHYTNRQRGNLFCMYRSCNKKVVNTIITHAFSFSSIFLFAILLKACCYLIKCYVIASILTFLNLRTMIVFVWCP